MAVYWNRTSGSAESNLVNLYDNAGISFEFAQKTGAATQNLLLRLGSSNFQVYTANTERFRIDSTGEVGIGNTTSTGTTLLISKDLTGASTRYGIRNTQLVPVSVAANYFAYAFSSSPTIQSAASSTGGTIYHYHANLGNLGGNTSGGLIINTQWGYYCNALDATTSYCFFANSVSLTSGGTASSSVSSVASAGTVVTITTAAAHGLTTGQRVTVPLTANATALLSGVTCTILTVGTTNFTLIGASSNTVGVSFTATGAGSGTGTVRVNQQGSSMGVTVVNATQFTYGSSITATFAAITASGTVTPSQVYNFYANGDAPNRFNGAVQNGSTVSVGTTTIRNWVHTVYEASNAYTQYLTSGTGTTATDGLLIGLASTGEAVVRNRESSSLLLYTADTVRMTVSSAGNIYGTAGTAAMTNGFFYIPSAAGAPTGVPTAVSGCVPMYYDTTNNNFYVYNGAWKKVLMA
jgi:hypothetical protein